MTVYYDDRHERSVAHGRKGARGKAVKRLTRPASA